MCRIIHGLCACFQNTENVQLRFTCPNDDKSERRKAEKTMKKKQFIADNFRTYSVDESTNILFFAVISLFHGIYCTPLPLTISLVNWKRFNGLNGPLWAMTNAFFIWSENWMPNRLYEIKNKENVFPSIRFIFQVFVYRKFKEN